MASGEERSRSPARDARPKKPKSNGFRWKEKRPRDAGEDSRHGGRLERGYRDRSPRRDGPRDGEGYRQRDDDRERRDDGRARCASPSREPEGAGGAARDQPRPRDQSPPTRPDVASKFGDYAPRARPEHGKPNPPPSRAAQPKPKKPAPAPAPTSHEPMMVVHVNDRLGTKAAIPCLASDSVKVFKAMVAAHVGRPPHEILLKRQGERPFKDHLTLQDYAVSNGVQLDLELDTAD